MQQRQQTDNALPLPLLCVLSSSKQVVVASMSSYRRESNFHLFRLHRAQKLTFQFPSVITNIIEIVEICTLCPDCVVSKRKKWRATLATSEMITCVGGEHVQKECAQLRCTVCNEALHQQQLRRRRRVPAPLPAVVAPHAETEGREWIWTRRWHHW